jgi:hypothetical protein
VPQPHRLLLVEMQMLLLYCSYLLRIVSPNLNRRSFKLESGMYVIVMNTSSIDPIESFPDILIFVPSPSGRRLAAESATAAESYKSCHGLVFLTSIHPSSSRSQHLFCSPSVPHSLSQSPSVSSPTMSETTSRMEHLLTVDNPSGSCSSSLYAVR